jgi:hypothetical protein
VAHAAGVGTTAGIAADVLVVEELDADPHTLQATAHASEVSQHARFVERVG